MLACQKGAVASRVVHTNVVSQARAATPMAMLSTSARPTKAQEELVIVSNALSEDGAVQTVAAQFVSALIASRRSLP